MSTYLVAVVVGDFDCVSAVHPESGVLTSVYTPVGCAAQGEFALKVGVDSLQLLTTLFGLPYMGGRKVDHIAIADFAAGAMENTGAITYREAALLIDPVSSSLAMKQRVAQVVAHELSHQ
jgi:aminopeptidase N